MAQEWRAAGAGFAQVLIASAGSPAATVTITVAQLAYVLDGIDWKNPVRAWRPEMAG